MSQRRVRPAHASRRNADRSGGELAPIPLSEALREALIFEANRSSRSPRDQALVILLWYFDLFPYHPTDLLYNEPSAVPSEIDAVDIDHALADIERLSRGEQ